MASKDLSDQLKDLTLEDVVLLNKDLGRGAYGKVFTVDVGTVNCNTYLMHTYL